MVPADAISAASCGSDRSAGLVSQLAPSRRGEHSGSFASTGANLVSGYAFVAVLTSPEARFTYGID